MERVLNEIEVVKHRMLELGGDKALLEDQISETQFQRSKLEQKIHMEKQKQIHDGAKLETNLKNEFEKNKLDLEDA